MTNRQSNTKCKIAIDAMGSDFAPPNDVVGAMQAFKENNNFQLFLVGDKAAILDTLKKNNLEHSEEFIVHAPEQITMSDSPATAIRTKKNSSLVVGATLVKEKKVDAFVSAGNTGAMLAASTLIMGRISGVSRPTIGASFPNAKNKFTMLFDAGASVDSKPQHLLEYAVLGTIFSREIYKIDKPKVGLLSVGEEKEKGNELTFSTHELLSKSNLNFLGNVEGRDILNGNVDVIVCDGFVGNVILKFGESVIGFLKSKVRSYADAGILNKIKALVTKSVLKDSLKDMDYQYHGGVPLLGVNGISIIGHGSSTPLAIKNMVLRAKEMYDLNILQKFKEALKYYAK
ncbi:MAG TPA: phosphate acyltransferase PlsX [Ignavibacteria bacterium]|nr:phosphate acyltransferase PlsX [Ignavibacteria bacterium]